MGGAGSDHGGERRNQKRRRGIKSSVGGEAELGAAESGSFYGDCKSQTEVLFDRSAGDTVCDLVLESHSVDETSEWRTFANESGDKDPVRVGSSANLLLSDGGLSTFIAKPNGSSDEFLS